MKKLNKALGFAGKIGILAGSEFLVWVVMIINNLEFFEIVLGMAAWAIFWGICFLHGVEEKSNELDVRMVSVRKHPFKYYTLSETDYYSLKEVE